MLKCVRNNFDGALGRSKVNYLFIGAETHKFLTKLSEIERVEEDYMKGQGYFGTNNLWEGMREPRSSLAPGLAHELVVTFETWLNARGKVIWPWLLLAGWRSIGTSFNAPRGKVSRSCSMMESYTRSFFFLITQTRLGSLRSVNCRLTRNVTRKLFIRQMMAAKSTMMADERKNKVCLIGAGNW